MRHAIWSDRTQAPGLGLYLWCLALVHLCVAVGLAQLWVARERGLPRASEPPLRVVLLHPDAGTEQAADGGREKSNQLFPGGDQAQSPDAEDPVEHAEPIVGESPATTQATEAPSTPTPQSEPASTDPPRVPSTHRRSTQPPERSVPRSPRHPTLVCHQPLGPDREAPGSPPGSLPEAVQRAERPRGLAPSSPVNTRERRVGSLPLLSDEDLAKYAQIPAGQPRSRPLYGVDTAISLNTTDVKYLAYFAHLKEKIERQWHYPPEAAAREIEGLLVLLFVLQQSGQVSRVELLRSAGATVLDRAAWEAALNARPFDPVPPHIWEEPLHVRARFTYLMEETAQRTRVQ